MNDIQRGREIAKKIADFGGRQPHYEMYPASSDEYLLDGFDREALLAYISALEEEHGAVGLMRKRCLRHGPCDDEYCIDRGVCQAFQKVGE